MENSQSEHRYRQRKLENNAFPNMGVESVTSSVSGLDARGPNGREFVLTF